MRYPAELARIVRHQRETETAGMRGDEQVVRADHGAPPFQIGANFCVIARGLAGKIQDLDVVKKGGKRRFILLLALSAPWRSRLGMGRGLVSIFGLRTRVSPRRLTIGVTGSGGSRR